MNTPASNQSSSASGAISVLLVVLAICGAVAAISRPALSKPVTPTAACCCCPKCGQTLTAQNGGDAHKCQAAPLSPAELDRRKAAAHALSAGDDSEFNIRSSDQSRPKDWSTYVKNDAAAVALGKALFWDMRVGSDDRTACATCHHHAGIDSRTKNTAFAFREKDFVTNKDQKPLANHQWSEADHFPWTDKDSERKDSKKFGLIVGDSSLVIGSQGVRRRDFDSDAFEAAWLAQKGQAKKLLKETGHVPVVKPKEFTGSDEQNFTLRQVTGRNSPTVINAGHLARLFHDGRASDIFNGYDVFGSDSPYQDHVGKYRVRNGRLVRVEIEIHSATAASQAVGPPLNPSEMSYKGRDFHHIAMKLLDSAPLMNQEVAADDSVLAKYRNGDKGLTTTYRQLIQDAFDESWWNQRGLPLAIPLNDEKPELGKPVKVIDDMMIANFSLYFGLAVMAYEQTLVSDDSPFDRFVRGEVLSLSAQARRGFEKFTSHGCADCHLMPEFSGATFAAIFGEAKEEEADEYEAPLPTPRPLPKPLNPDGFAFVEEMLFKVPEPRFRAYDNGFYNIGVTGLGDKRYFDFGIGAEIRVTKPATHATTTDAEQALEMIAPNIRGNFNESGKKTLKTKKSRALSNPEAANQKAADGTPANRATDNNAATQTAAGKPNPEYFRPSKARKRFPNQSPVKDGQSAVNGAFKTPSLRNIAQTTPYMHNGAFVTLKEVLRFYRYGPRLITGDNESVKFHHPELIDLRANLLTAPDGDDDIIAFLKALTDERVLRHAAPFDHPSLTLPSGNLKADGDKRDNDLDEITTLPATGKVGHDNPLALQKDWLDFEFK